MLPRAPGARLDEAERRGGGEIRSRGNAGHRIDVPGAATQVGSKSLLSRRKGIRDSHGIERRSPMKMEIAFVLHE